MSPDDELCYCFHVTRRKLVNFVRRQRPQVASQLAECGGAGTGCGWCIPFLKQIHRQSGDDLELPTAEEYAQRRGDYLREGGGIPPAGATPPPPQDS